MKKPTIVIFASTGLRHAFFVSQLARNFHVLRVIVEAKRPQPKGVIGDKIMLRHLKGWNRKELEFFRDAKPIPKKLLLKADANSKQTFTLLKLLNPDYLVLFGSSIIGATVLNLFQNRVINMHLGLSPYYRGTATNFWPLVNGEPECVGVTIHFAVEKVDAGEIILQGRPDIKPEDDCHTIGCKAIIKGTELMVCILNKMDKMIPSKQEGIGKLFKRKDFNADSVLTMQGNFKNGMIPSYLREKMIRDIKFPIKETL